MARKAKIEIFSAPHYGGDRWFIRVRAANGETIGTGAEGYDSKGNAKKAAKRLVTTVAKAEIVDG